MLLDLLRVILRMLPPRVPEIIYTVVLRPRILRRATNWLLLRFAPKSVEVDGLTLYLNPKDPVLTSAVALGIYENFERDVFRDYCKPGATVVDIGANVGLYTAIAAAKVGPRGTIVAIEPHPESYRHLSMTVAENQLQTVRAFQVAAGNSKQLIPLFVTEDNKADSRIYDSTGRRENTPVQMVEVDSLLKEIGIRRVDLIKMDIQGAEALALAGMRRTLDQNPGVVIFAEFWPWGIEQTGQSPLALLDELEQAGFSFRKIDEDNRCVIDIDDPKELVRGHDQLQYTGVDLRRSHANLICFRRTPAEKEQELTVSGAAVEQI